ncbi:hypothetical protein [Bowmanella dokdonensis]|uniref:Lipoprotein n=1 Tax=Bowmanella dokdonensis TaxID=751969 RepID=A0A939DLD2_9ALTE|nr:hypothetical protein [Bowmanella dokdonensis]MBN7824767.1 hypothetical protein [Bowmanella dokdonensis]
MFRMALLFIALVVSGCGKTGTQEKHPTKGGAWQFCELAVKNRLKAPASADFSGVSETTVTEQRVTQMEGGDRKVIYQVSGWVDAQNSYGATIRNSYICEVEGRTGTSWKVLSLIID